MGSAGKSIHELQDAAWEALEQGENAQALKLAKQLKKRRHTSNFELGALALVAMGEQEKAIELLREGVDVAPDLCILWHLMGSILSNAGRYDEALQAYDRASKCLGNELESIALNKAILLQRQGRHEESLQLIEQYAPVAKSQTALAFLAHRLTALNELNRYRETLDLQPALEKISPRINDKSVETVSEQERPDYSLTREGVRFIDMQSLHEAEAWIQVLIARRHTGATDDELIDLAKRALLSDNCNSNALRWLREIRGQCSNSSRKWDVMVEGELNDDSCEAALGFVRKYEVVAETPEEVMEFIGELDPDGVRLTECEPTEDQPAAGTLFKGVYYVSGHYLFPLDEE